MKKYRFYYYFLGFIVLCVIVKAIVLGSIRNLCILDEGLPKQFSAYIYSEIYKHAGNDKQIAIMLNDIRENRNNYLFTKYYRILAVAGQVKDAHVYIDNYGTDRSIDFIILQSLGLLAYDNSKDVLSFLNDLLFDQNLNDNFMVAQAIYFLTKEKVRYKDINSKFYYFEPSELHRSIINILESKGSRQRSYHEMIQLDKLYTSSS